MISLQTNVASLVAQQNLNIDQMFQTQTITQLTSGYRINSSGDDAAGLAVANQDKSQIAQLTQGVQNGNNAVAQLQIMDGGMSNISQILDRLQTLATESASGTFTGDRSTLNNEFQTDIQEIDRQAQSIGLNTGGTFASNLTVFLGEGSGSQSLNNAVVGLNLSAATVDSQSLGLTGYQAIAGTADLSSSSATSVANILANTTNQSGELVAGDATFDFSGSGYSGLQVNVNLSGVSDINSLVNNINAAIQSAASGSSSAAAAFKAAGITASVNTAADGSEQLAFTSSTGAFQVQAGDQMANALMGNFSSGTTGVSLATSVTGQAAAADATTLTAGQNIFVQISGAGLSSPQTIELQQANDATVADAVTDLKAQVSGNTALQAAGISVTQNSAGQIVFTNANDSPFQVTASGDTGNLLGLGSYLASGSNAQYTSITAGATYATTGLTASNANSQTTLQFSINGGPAVTLAPIALDGGDSTAGTNTSAAITDNGVVIGSGANAGQFSFTVDGKTVTTNLAATTNGGAAVYTGTGATTFATDYSSTAGKILMTVDGVSKVVSMTTNDTDIADAQTDLQAGIDAAFGAGTVTVGQNAGGTQLTLTTNSTGLNSQIILGDSGDGTLANLGFTATSVNGSGYTAAQIATAMNTAISDAQQAIDPTTGLEGTLYTGPGNTPLGATVTVDGSNDLVITNSNGGADHTIGNVTGNGAAAVWGGTGAVADGTNRSLGNLVNAINQEIQNNSTLTAAGIQASNNGGSLEISSTNATMFQLNAGASPAAAKVTGNVDLTNGGNFGTSPVTLNLLVNGATQSVTLNQNEANASAIASAINQQLTGATASVVQVNGKQYLQLTDSTSGPTDSLQVLSGTANSVLGLTAGTYSGANEASVGFGTSGISNAGSLGVAAAASSLSAVNAGGTAQTGGISFTALAAGAGTQALTISAVNASGVTQSTTITLAATGDGTVSLGNDGSASSIGNAVAYINQQLQKTNNPTLQGIVAVEQNVNGVNEINFMSPSNTFQVAIGTNATGGLNAGAAETATGKITGQGGSLSIDSQANAEAAVSAIASAVSKLGQAQAVIGKGENQLNYAVSLANSQITNVSVAESNIMDANVAAEAANLSKAQVLNQAAVAAMAQANSAPQAVLSLLRG